MAYTINQTDVMTSLNNLMGHRVAPGGTDDDWKRFVQESFNYCWRYYKWTFSLASGTIDEADGLLPEDYDHEGWHSIPDITEVNIQDTLATGNTGSAIIWDAAQTRYRLEPLAGGSIVYQVVPPTLGTDEDGSAPFPSARVVAIGSTVYAKQAENPTRADVTQEWDMFHSELDRLVGRADANRIRTPQNYHSRAGTFTGDVG